MTQTSTSPTDVDLDAITTEATPIHAASGRARLFRALAIVVAVLIVAALTGIVFLVRAGAIDGSNWPISWELQNSDSGVLFQVARELLAGHRLDWSFSGQVYVFPEIPLSLVAYVLGAGGIYRYFLFVALINNSLVFLTLLGVIRVRWSTERMMSSLAKAGLAITPLLVLPLIGTPELLMYQLGATYYIGMYLMVMAAPLFFLAKRRWVRILVGVALALTAASNPLSLVFAFPAFVVVLLVRWIKQGFRSVLRPGIAVVVVLAIALAVRLAFFGKMQGTSPTNYMDLGGLFSHRIPDLKAYFSIVLSNPVSRVVIVIGVISAVACLVGAVVVAVRYLRRGVARNDRLLISIYFGLVPLGGLAGTLVLGITHYLYLWLILIAPMAFLLAAVPGRWAKRLLPVAAVGFIVTVLLTGGITNIENRQAFFGYRSTETVCLDEKLPAGMTIGYSTFSDARRVSLTSKRGIELIEVAQNGLPIYWLTNRADARDDTGTFFYINPLGNEAPLDRASLTKSFGEPDGTVDCGNSQTAIYYTDPAKIQKIETFYRVFAQK